MRHGLSEKKQEESDLEAGDTQKNLDNRNKTTSISSWKDNYDEWQKLRSIEALERASVIHASVGFQQIRLLATHLEKNKQPNLNCKYADFAMIDEGVLVPVQTIAEGMVNLDHRVARSFVADIAAMVGHEKRIRFDKQKAVNLLYQILYQYPELYFKLATLNPIEPISPGSFFPLTSDFIQFVKSFKGESQIATAMHHNPYEFLESLKSKLRDRILKVEDSLHNKLLSLWIERQMILIHDVERIMGEIDDFMDSVGRDYVYVNGHYIKRIDVDLSHDTKKIREKRLRFFQKRL